jgi:hypothetical protein
MTDTAFLTPEMFAMLVNNGLGGIAVILLFHVNARLGRLANIADDHERRLRALERRAGVDTDTIKRAP